LFKFKNTSITIITNIFVQSRKWLVNNNIIHSTEFTIIHNENGVKFFNTSFIHTNILTYNSLHFLISKTYVSIIFFVAGPKTISSAGLFFNNIGFVPLCWPSLVIPRGSDITSNWKFWLYNAILYDYYG